MADSLAAALAALQANPPRIRKTRPGQHNKYADLPAVTTALRPVLASLGLLWQTWPGFLLTNDGPRFVIHWKISHLPSGESVEGQYPIHATDPQRAGSEITYARRYALVTVTGVTPEGDDDDGQAAARPQRTPAKIPGPDHERLRNGTVEPTPDDRPTQRLREADHADPWAAADRAADEAEHRPASIGEPQRRAVMRLFKDWGRDERLAEVSRIIGREVGSVNELSMHEAGLVIADMQKAGRKQ